MRKQLLTVCSLALLVFAASPSSAFDGDIGIFADQGLAQCQASYDCSGGTPTTLFVYAILRGASADGISGAEYSIGQSADAGHSYFTDYSHVQGEGATRLGNSIGGALNGVNIAWPDCQTGDNSGNTVLLEVINVVPSGTCTPNTLTVVKHDDQSNDFFLCPLFTLCDDPAFTKVCLGFNKQNCQNPNPPFANDSTCSTSGEFFENPDEGFNCTVAVEETTWSEVKNLYN